MSTYPYFSGASGKHKSGNNFFGQPIRHKGVVLGLRCTSTRSFLCVAAPLAPEASHGQVSVTMLVHATYFSVLATKWPWKVPALNVVDAVSALMMTMFMALSVVQLSLPTQAASDSFVALMVFAMCAEVVLILLSLVGTVAAIFYGGISAKVLSGRCAPFFTLNKVPDSERAALHLLSTCGMLKRDFNKTSLVEVMGPMTLHGHKSTAEVIDILISVGIKVDCRSETGKLVGRVVGDLPE